MIRNRHFSSRFLKQFIAEKFADNLTYYNKESSNYSSINNGVTCFGNNVSVHGPWLMDYRRLTSSFETLHSGLIIGVQTSMMNLLFYVIVTNKARNYHIIVNVSKRRTEWISTDSTQAVKLTDLTRTTISMQEWLLLTVKQCSLALVGNFLIERKLTSPKNMSKYSMRM